MSDKGHLNKQRLELDEPQSRDITPDDGKRTASGIFSGARRKISGLMKTLFQNHEENKLKIRLAQSGNLTDDEQHSLAEDLLGNQKGYLLAKYLDRFPSLDHNWVVRRLMETRQSGAIILELNKFRNLDAATSKSVDQEYYLIAPSLFHP